MLRLPVEGPVLTQLNRKVVELPALRYAADRGEATFADSHYASPARTRTTPWPVTTRQPNRSPAPLSESAEAATSRYQALFVDLLA